MHRHTRIRSKRLPSLKSFGKIRERLYKHKHVFMVNIPWPLPRHEPTWEGIKPTGQDRWLLGAVWTFPFQLSLTSDLEVLFGQWGVQLPAGLLSSDWPNSVLRSQCLSFHIRWTQWPGGFPKCWWQWTFSSNELAHEVWTHTTGRGRTASVRGLGCCFLS